MKSNWSLGIAVVVISLFGMRTAAGQEFYAAPQYQIDGAVEVYDSIPDSNLGSFPQPIQQSSYEVPYAPPYYADSGFSDPVITPGQTFAQPGATAVTQAVYKSGGYSSKSISPGLAQQKAAQAASMSFRDHVGGSLGGANYEGVGWSNRSAQAAISNCCYWGQRTPAQIGVAKSADGCWYACVLYY